MDTIPTSYSEITVENALQMTAILCNLSNKFTGDGNLEDLHKALKQINRLYFDCKPARLLISESLLKLKFADYAVKVMKQLNNLSIFKSDDIWFSTFYFYNICWNYSEINQKFASALLASGIDIMININLMHSPYIENLAKVNVHNLIKMTLCIMQNIIVVPDNRRRFSSDKVISALFGLGKGTGDIAIRAIICLGYIACNENVLTSQEFDIYYNLKLLLYYVKSASTTNDKHMGFYMLEFLKVLRASSLCITQRNAIISLGGLDMMLNHLQKTNDDRNKTEVLLILANIIDCDNKTKIHEIAEFYVTSNQKRELEDIENRSIEMDSHFTKLKSAAKHLLWKLTSSDVLFVEDLVGVKVFVNFADSDQKKARVIFNKLKECNMVPLESHENDWELLKRSYEEASIVIVCVSASFKNATYFVTGTDYCLHNKKVVFPVLVDKSYKAEGWLKTFITASSDVCYNLSTDVSMVSEWPAFKAAVKAQLANVVAGAPLDMEKESQVEDNLTVMECINVADMSQEDIDSNVMHQWLTDNRLSHLKPRIPAMTRNMLLTLKDMRKTAPDYFFNALEKHLQLSFTEILQFNYALNSLPESH